MIANFQVNAVLSGGILFPADFHLRQAFWCTGGGVSSAHHFFIENSSGLVYTVRLKGLGQNPEALIPYFPAEISSAGQVECALNKAFLFPPPLSAQIMPAAPCNPVAFLRDEYPGFPAAEHPAADEFFSRLNHEITAALGPDATAGAYSFLQALPKHVFRNRMQAAAAKYPWIKADLGLGTVRPPLPSVSAAVLYQIDTGAPYERGLAEQYGVDRHALRCVGLLCRNLYSWEDLPAILVVVAAMKPDFRMRVRSSWGDLFALLRWFARWELPADKAFFKQFSAEIFSDGIAGAIRIFKRELPGNYNDPSFALEEYLMSRLPIDVPRSGFRESFGQLFRARVQACGSVVGVFSECWAWQKAQVDAANQRHRSLAWAPLLKEKQKDFGHFRARELTCAADLLVEGVSQKNCVYEYASLCAYGEVFIFSLEHHNASHQRRTTAHVALGSDGKLRLAEHSAYNNTSAGPAATADAAQLLAFLIDVLKTNNRE